MSSLVKLIKIALGVAVVSAAMILSIIVLLSNLK